MIDIKEVWLCNLDLNKGGDELWGVMKQLQAAILKTDDEDYTNTYGTLFSVEKYPTFEAIDQLMDQRNWNLIRGQ